MITGKNYRVQIVPGYVEIYSQGEIRTVGDFVRGYSLTLERRVFIQGVEGCYLYYSVFLSREILTSYKELKYYLLKIKKLGYIVELSDGCSILRYIRKGQGNFRISNSQRVEFLKIPETVTTSPERYFWLNFFLETP